MSKRQPRFEIVRTAAGWHARYKASNGQVIFASEVYTRRRGVVSAIHSIARSFWGFASFDYDEIGVLFVGDGGGRYLEVRELDERC